MALKYLWPSPFWFHAPNYDTLPPLASPQTQIQPTRRALINSALIFSISTTPLTATASSSKNEFLELPNSGGVKALDLRLGSGSQLPIDGDHVAIHYYARLAAKQGWRFDSTYDHKDNSGEPIPFTFLLGSPNVISGIQMAVRSMKAGGIRRVVIPPSQGYQNITQQPLPPDAEAFYYYFQSNASRQRRRFYVGYSHLRHRASQLQA